MTDTTELADLRRRVERLEARDACVSAFNEYLHYLDGGLTDELMEVFAPDAALDVVNFPPGSGKDLAFHGRDEIRGLYGRVPAGMSRHHSANVTVDVADDAQQAELSAYFLTSSAYGIGGGVYQGTLAPTDVRWQFRALRIVSTWGWVLPQDAPPYLAEHLGTGALRDGRPVTVRLAGARGDGAS
jgi:hypothetical protein